MHVTTTALDTGFVHIALARGPDTVRVICTRPADGTQMIFSLSPDEALKLSIALQREFYNNRGEQL